MEGKITNWSAENATKAYLKTLKMGIKRPTEPDVSEFISAIAAGNNAQLIVVTSGEETSLTTLLALLAAAYQTGGRVICIFHGLQELQSTKEALSHENSTELIEFVIGNPITLLLEDYKEADFVLNDCKLINHESILRAMQMNSVKKCKGSIVLGCNALCSSSSSSSWQWTGLKTQLLPIGEGLLVTKMERGNEKKEQRRCGSFGRKSHWIKRIDQHTGEEHVFRVRCPNGKDMDD
ncbi:unnamed protein product [Amaranthus hypochondriacus]